MTTENDAGGAERTGGSGLPASAHARRRQRHSLVPRTSRHVVRAWVQWVTEPRPKIKTALRWTLLISLLSHAVLVPGIPQAMKSGSSGGVMEQQHEYLKKVEASRSARVLAKEIDIKETMPPPPKDPQEAAASTISEAVTKDLGKVIGNLTSVKVKDDLLTKVNASLKDEIAEASQKIADGKLSKKEIEDLFDDFKKKAQKVATVVREEQLVEDQTDRAATSTTEWYENSFSSTIVRNMKWELYPPPGYKSWPPNPERWNGIFRGGGKSLNWSDLRSNELLYTKIEHIKKVLAYELTKKNKDGSGLTMAQRAEVLVNEYNLQFKGTVGWPSWKQLLQGGVEQFIVTAYHQGNVFDHPTDGLLREFYITNPEEPAPNIKAAEAIFAQLETQTADFKKKADAEAPAAELEEAQTACIKTFKDLADALAKLGIPEERAGFGKAPRRTLNAILRAQVLKGPYHEEMYKYFLDFMVEGFAPLIRDMVKSQFEKGIIKQKDGVEKAMEEFPSMILPLVRRDISKVVPKDWFDGAIFMSAQPFRTYKSLMPGETAYSPGPEEFEADNKLLDKILTDRPDLKTYAEKRKDMLQRRLKITLKEVREYLLTLASSGNLLTRSFSSFGEGVDYHDELTDAMKARAAAQVGRKQDLAQLTADGVPDTNAALLSLAIQGDKKHSAPLEPFMTTRRANYMTKSQSAIAMRKTAPTPPPPFAKWGFETQLQVKAPDAFKTANFEAIPFLPNFPNLDGNLSDWGKIRPLFLKGPAGKEINVYAAWNYQGFFFGYHVERSAEFFYYPVNNKVTVGRKASFFGGGLTGKIGTVKSEGSAWAFAGDHFRLLFDTLDARNANRGERHTQEFIVFPRGTDQDPELPGAERTIDSQRDAKAKEYRGIKDSLTVFPKQPPSELGPDGAGPYRVTQFGVDGYTTEIFLARDLFKQPVFAPGWYVGFDCAVASGSAVQRYSQAWADGRSTKAGEGGLNPSSWGDLLLLGTDPRVILQEANESYTTADSIVPGHSYLLTVIDPDRNVNLSVEDIIMVSAESNGGNQDVEVFIIKETGKNTGVFRGFINTQPGAGREVQGVLEVMPGQEIRFGYVDFANAKGVRNLVTEMKVPVVGGILQALKK